MFDFGWIRTHLRVVFGDIYELFWVQELNFWKNGRNKQKYGQEVGGPSPWRRPMPRRSRMANLAILGFTAAKTLFTTWQCCVFVSFCFSVVLKTCLLD